MAKNEISNTLEIIAKGCIVSAPGDCTVNYNGNPTNTIDTYTIATEYFRNYHLEIFFVESTHDVSNFDKPISKNMKKVSLQFNARKIMTVANRFSEIKTLTSSGTF